MSGIVKAHVALVTVSVAELVGEVREGVRAALKERDMAITDSAGRELLGSELEDAIRGIATATAQSLYRNHRSKT